jgi:hypothetical protein
MDFWLYRSRVQQPAASRSPAILLSCTARRRLARWDYFSREPASNGVLAISVCQVAMLGLMASCLVASMAVHGPRVQRSALCNTGEFSK